MLDFVGGYPYSGPSRPFMDQGTFSSVASIAGEEIYDENLGRVELAAQDLQGPLKIKVVSWSIQDMNTKIDFGDLEQRFQNKLLHSNHQICTKNSNIQ